MDQDLSPGMRAVSKVIKELLAQAGFSEEESCEIMLDIITDLIVDGNNTFGLSALNERIVHWGVQFHRAAVDKAAGRVGPIPSRIPALRPPPMFQSPPVFPPDSRARAFPPPSGVPIVYAAAGLEPEEPVPPQRTKLSTSLTIDGKRMPAYVRNEQDGKWTVVICFGNWEPGQILRSVERCEYDTEEAAKKALESAAEDLCLALEPWIPLSGP